MVRPKPDSDTANAPQEPRVLSTCDLGTVSVCPAGCLHIDTPSVSFRLTENSYFQLLDMLVRAATALKDADNSEHVH